jgi:hypothetical protein
MHSRANPGQVSQNETLTAVFPEREGESAGEKRKRGAFSGAAREFAKETRGGSRFNYGWELGRAYI